MRERKKETVKKRGIQRFIEGEAVRDGKVKRQMVSRTENQRGRQRERERGRKGGRERERQRAKRIMTVMAAILRDGRERDCER